MGWGSWVLLATVVFSFAAHSAEIEGVTFADSVSVDGRTLYLNGMGLRKKTIFNVKVYAAALYLTAPMQDPDLILASDEPKRLDITFMRNVEGKDIATSWDEGLALNCKTDCQRFAQATERLKALSRDLTNGQTVMFVFRKDSLEMKMGESSPQIFEGRPFTNLILSNFIGVPPSLELKVGLLGPASPVIRVPVSDRAP